MSLNRYAKKRDKNEPEIIRAFQSVGCHVRQIDVPCDLIVCHPYIIHNLLIECKMPNGRTTDIQQDMLDNWPSQYDIVYNGQQAIDLINSKIGESMSGTTSPKKPPKKTDYNKTKKTRK